MKDFLYAPLNANSDLLDSSKSAVAALSAVCLVLANSWKCVRLPRGGGQRQREASGNKYECRFQQVCWYSLVWNTAIRWTRGGGVQSLLAEVASTQHYSWYIWADLIYSQQLTGFFFICARPVSSRTDLSPLKDSKTSAAPFYLTDICHVVAFSHSHRHWFRLSVAHVHRGADTESVTKTSSVKSSRRRVASYFNKTCIAERRRRLDSSSFGRLRRKIFFLFSLIPKLCSQTFDLPPLPRFSPSPSKSNAPCVDVV